MHRIISTFIILGVVHFCKAQNLKSYDLLITEIMSDPTPTVGIYPEEEYLEIYNNTTFPVELADIEIIIGKKTLIPDSAVLQPDSFFVFWDPPTLRNSGDSILIKSTNKTIHRVDYTPSFYTSDFKENGGWSLELKDFTKPCIVNQNWQESIDNSGGTPGRASSIAEKISGTKMQCINGFATNDSSVTLLFNYPVTAVSDSSFMMNGQVLEVIKVNFNEVLLGTTQLDPGTIYSIELNNISTCFNAPLTAQTIKIGLPELAIYNDIVISEILFNPDQLGSDYIEIYNRSEKNIDVSKLLWTSRNESGSLESGKPLSEQPLIIFPNSYLVFCADTAWLKRSWTQAKNYINRPIVNMNNDEDNIVLITKNATVIDEINYQEDWHFNELSDFENVALEKINLNGKKEASNWTSAATSVNYGTPGYKNSNFQNSIETHKTFQLSYDVISPNMDGYHDQLVLNYNFKQSNWLVTIKVYNHLGQEMHVISNNELMGTNGQVIWDGFTNLKTIPAGIYVLHITGSHSESGKNIKQNLTFYINNKWQ